MSIAKTLTGMRESLERIGDRIAPLAGPARAAVYQEIAAILHLADVAALDSICELADLAGHRAKAVMAEPLPAGANDAPADDGVRPRD